MLPGLIIIAKVLAATTGGRLDRDHYAGARRTHPAGQVRTGAETIDGMLYVGLRPASHDAA